MEFWGNRAWIRWPNFSTQCCDILFKAMNSLVKWASLWEDPEGLKSETGLLSLSEDWLFLFTDSKLNFSKTRGKETGPGVPKCLCSLFKVSLASLGSIGHDDQSHCPHGAALPLSPPFPLARGMLTPHPPSLSDRARVVPLTLPSPHLQSWPVTCGSGPLLAFPGSGCT